jgi:hypothetical protein
VSLQIRLDISRVQSEHDDCIIIAQLPPQSVHKLNSSELVLRIQDPRVLFLSYIGIGDPVVFDGRVEVVVDGGHDPDDSAGIFGGGGRDEQSIEESD